MAAGVSCIFAGMPSIQGRARPAASGRRGRGAHAVHEDVGHQRGDVRELAVPVEGSRAQEARAERLRTPRNTATGVPSASKPSVNFHVRPSSCPSAWQPAHVMPRPVFVWKRSNPASATLTAESGMTDDAGRGDYWSEAG